MLVQDMRRMSLAISSTGSFDYSFPAPNKSGKLSICTRFCLRIEELLERPILNGRNCQDIIKASGPHLVLYAVNAIYTALGALLFMRLESANDIIDQIEQRKVLKEIYDSVANSTFAGCTRRPLDQREFQTLVGQNLVKVSLFHERTNYAVSPFLNATDDTYINHWNFKAALIYALTEITTNGYNDLSAQTKMGKVMSVGYALFGIPLMFMTAADVGKLLSELVTSCWERARGYFRDFECTVCQTKAKKAETANKRFSMSRLRKMSLILHSMPIEVPGLIIAFLAFGYISLGGIIFMIYRNWNFIESVHFSFDAMTSITLGYTPVDSISYLIWLYYFLIFGLSVITMCLDLARMKIRNLFVRLHYYGLKFGRLSHGWMGDGQMNLDPDVLMLAEAIRELREMGFDTMDISVVLEHWKKKKEAELELQRLLSGAYKPEELRFIRFVDEKGSIKSYSLKPSIASTEEYELF